MRPMQLKPTEISIFLFIKMYCCKEAESYIFIIFHSFFPNR